MPFQLNNRLDVLDEQDTWLEARVIAVNGILGVKRCLLSPEYRSKRIELRFITTDTQRNLMSGYQMTLVNSDIKLLFKVSDCFRPYC